MQLYKYAGMQVCNYAIKSEKLRCHFLTKLSLCKPSILSKNFFYKSIWTWCTIWECLMNSESLAVILSLSKQSIESKKFCYKICSVVYAIWEFHINVLGLSCAKLKFWWSLSWHYSLSSLLACVVTGAWFCKTNANLNPSWSIVEVEDDCSHHF